MRFIIADTFSDSLAKLTAQEQKAVKSTAFDLQIDPSRPDLQYHKLDRAQDPNFASIKVSRDIRIIVHRTKSSFMICYVDHHDAAYQWAQRRKLETHPTTGAAQFVEIRETVKEIVIPTYITKDHPKPPVLGHVKKDELLLYGVPLEWLDDVITATEDNIFELVDHLPQEAAEAVLELATGGIPIITTVATTVEDPFEHPDALRRFRVMDNIEDLEQALAYPWDKWTIFLHPAQKSVVEGHYRGPARVSGSAGTGKTVVALHRAVYLAKNNLHARVLLATFSETLANALKEKLRRLIHYQPQLADQIEVYSMNAIGERLYRRLFGVLKIAPREVIADLISQASKKVENHRFSDAFIMTEWEQVVDAWQLNTWEEYQNVLRLGRKIRLPEDRRKVLWSIFEIIRKALEDVGHLTYASMFERLTLHYKADNRSPFDFIVVDESQDISIAQLKLLGALAENQPDSLFFAGDLGQRIFQQPFSWKVLGVDIRGRSQTLRINYRTSHQIRMFADKLLDPEISDVDGNIESRAGTISVFNGPIPVIKTFASEEKEIDAVKEQVQRWIEDGLALHEIGIFVRSEKELRRAKLPVESLEHPYNVLDEMVSITEGFLSISTMHLAKGLEFRAVIVMACDDEVIPLQERIEMVADESDLLEVYNTERHLLYVACTRARDHLLLTGLEPVSEFLDDLRM
jgi:superfamily I DNA/RNA helicase/mRNA-degrading endonuclease RelE of RelBE toxin-antitoxin system